MEQEQTVSSQVEPDSPAPQVPKIKNSLVLIMSVLLIITVAITGLFYFQIQKLSRELSKYQIPPSPTPSATPDLTAGWKTYTNTKYNFSIRYPESWESVADTKNAPVATNILEKDLTFEAIFLDKTRELMCGPYACYPSVQINTPIKDNNKIKLALKEWVVNYIKSKSPEMKLDPASSTKEVQIDNHQAVKFDNTIFISSNGFIYLITFDASGSSAGNISAKDNIQNVFDQILSTFQFTEATSSAKPTPTSKACTLEAKVCPDGSSVGRTGPNCEFPLCSQ